MSWKVQTSKMSSCFPLSLIVLGLFLLMLYEVKEDLHFTLRCHRFLEVRDVRSCVGNKAKKRNTSNEKELCFECQTWCKPVVTGCRAGLQGKGACGQICEFLPVWRRTLSKETCQEINWNRKQEALLPAGQIQCLDWPIRSSSSIYFLIKI